MKRSLFALALAILVVFSACHNEPENTDPNASPSIEEIEQVYPHQTGETVNVMLDGEMVEMERIGDLLIFQGDMVFTVKDFPDQFRSQIVGYTSNKRWPNKTLYYTIAANVSHRKADIEWAAAHITNNTDLSVVKRNGQNSYVRVKNGSGCSSYVGRLGGRQDITISNGCGRGSIVHEFLHAAGAKHEHTRRDRDDYLTIKWENIKDGKGHNFSKAGNKFLDFTSGMNYSSIMMYSQKAFSKNGKKTIVRKDGKSYTTQRNKLSNKDIEGINAMY